MALIRLIHTADIHLDRCYSNARFPSSFANRRRQSVCDAFLRVICRAGDWPADALLIAGDLIEHERVSRDTVAMLYNAFAGISPVPVFIAPGNRDPFTPGSPYARHRWPENVFIFSTPAWSAFSLDRVPLTVHGFAFDAPELSTNPLTRLSLPADGRVHVAVGHASETGSLPSGKQAHAPFDANQFTANGLRYLALGHYHAATHIPVKNEAWVQYSGSPEGLDFTEPGIHAHIEVEIDGPDIRVREVPSANAVFETHTVDCTTLENAQAIIDAIRSLPAPPSVKRIARIVLTGLVPLELLADASAIYDRIRADYDYLELVNRLEVEEDFEALGLEQTSRGAFIRELNLQLRDTTEPRRRYLISRARELGLAAYRGRMLPVSVETGE